tara:strand:- start:477 stop:1304 length:828 start_codon:yes stop_codon:yes gene_type:complete
VKLNFLKMHGLGNDFVLLDGVSQSLALTPEQVMHLCDRKYGIGCDQLLIVENTDLPEVDFKYRIFNCDGSEVEQCGNGARCFAQFVKRQGLIERDKMRVETLAGVYAIEIIDHTLVKVDMGQPEFDPAKIPFMPAQQDTHQIQIKQQQINFQVVSIGNPHAVIFVDDVDAVALGDIGSQLEVDPRFPQRTNVQFVQIVDSETIKQRIFERGAGETMASGSGACAAVAVGQKYKNLAAHVVVNMPGGKLSINADPISHTLYMTGPTEISFEGSIHL